MSILNTILLIVAFALIGYVAFVIFFLQKKPRKITDFSGKHVVITGGSSGLGLSLASQLAELGSNVSLIARSKEKLEKARSEVNERGKLRGRSGKFVDVFSADVSEYKSISSAIDSSIKSFGTPDVLIINAGSSRPGYFLEIPVEDMEKEVKLNYLGGVNTVKAALPSMAKKEGGHINFVSSAAALYPFVGYANYAATKCAVKGLAEALRNELILYNIDVSIYYPSGIDTEGFAEEQKTKPEETKKIEGAASHMTPEQAAKILVKGFQSGNFATTAEFFPSELLRVVSHGISVRNNFLLDVFLAPILVLAAPLINNDTDGVVTASRNKSKKNQ
eukprot:TRINITY_DN2433_c0_g1_i1.p1 TRINITY_DN2433_c0_g1~~TRINITY_DN2433_c0_g1_i1.p1  ORF type:complete len:333 (+),score=138.73 TRINITY_DN2433_c0_g1_i1:71-1069(+)